MSYVNAGNMRVQADGNGKVDDMIRVIQPSGAHFNAADNTDKHVYVTVAGAEVSQSRAIFDTYKGLIANPRKDALGRYVGSDATVPEAAITAAP